MSMIDSWSFLLRGTTGVYDSSFNQAGFCPLDQKIPDTERIVEKDDGSIIVEGIYKVSGPSRNEREKMAAHWNKTYQVCRWTMNTLIGGEVILGRILISKWIEDEGSPFHNNNLVKTEMIVFLSCILMTLIVWKEQSLSSADEHSKKWNVNAQIQLAYQLIPES